MTKSSQGIDDKSPWPRVPTQFSLKTLLIGITLVAVCLGLSAVLPSVFQGVLRTLVWPVVAAIVFPSLLMVALFSHGHRQAFAAGSLLTLVLGFFAANSMLGAIIWLCLAIFSGFVAIRMRYWLEKQGWDRLE